MERRGGSVNLFNRFKKERKKDCFAIGQVGHILVVVVECGKTRWKV